MLRLGKSSNCTDPKPLADEPYRWRINFEISHPKKITSSKAYVHSPKKNKQLSHRPPTYRENKHNFTQGYPTRQLKLTNFRAPPAPPQAAGDGAAGPFVCSANRVSAGACALVSALRGRTEGECGWACPKTPEAEDGRAVTGPHAFAAATVS